jgi:hypothetical protein
LTEKEKTYNRKLGEETGGDWTYQCENKNIQEYGISISMSCRNRHSLRMNLICGIINYDRNV